MKSKKKFFDVFFVSVDMDAFFFLFYDDDYRDHINIILHDFESFEVTLTGTFKEKKKI